MSDVAKIVLSFIFSGAVLSFVQFLITRRDNKKTMTKLLSDQLQDVKTEVKEFMGEFQKYKATLARTHILRFSDELRNGIEHSDEYFKQQILDIDTYNRYCETHPEFENGLTVMASEYIREEYKRQYLSNDN